MTNEPDKKRSLDPIEKLLAEASDLDAARFLVALAARGLSHRPLDWEAETALEASAARLYALAKRRLTPRHLAALKHAAERVEAHVRTKYLAGGSQAARAAWRDSLSVNLAALDKAISKLIATEALAASLM